MTNKEALIACLQVVTMPDNALVKALIDRSVVGTVDYTAASASGIDLATIDLLQGLLSNPDITEGGYSIRFDRTAVQNRLLFLARKNNATEVIAAIAPVPTIKGASPW
ncbi:MAG TPA: DUF6706 family protein [Puia sp.]|jgi:hypothetical protein